MDMPTTGSDEMIEIDEGRRQEARDDTAELACNGFSRQDDDQRPRETAHGRVRRIVKRRALRLALAVLQAKVAEQRASANCTR